MGPDKVCVAVGKRREITQLPLLSPAALVRRPRGDANLGPQHCSSWLVTWAFFTSPPLSLSCGFFFFFAVVVSS